MIDLLIAGSVALDTIKTPFGQKRDVLGGSAVHAAVAASFYAKVGLVGVVGEDFPQSHLEFLHRRSIDTAGLEIAKGETFRWSGYYEYDMNQAHTLDTRLNVLASFSPKIPDSFKGAPFLFLANVDPDAQLKVIAQMDQDSMVAADTMNFWIESKRAKLHSVLKKAHFFLLNEGEAREFMQTPSLVVAGKRLRESGAKTAVIKKGEHGALLFSDESFFVVPPYPQEGVIDPTGAGDSFAGGFMGYLAKTKDLSDANIRRAAIIGSVMASFNIEDFSLDRMRRLTRPEIVGRFEEFQKFSAFEPLVHQI